MPIASWDKFGIPELLHVILNCIYKYYAKNKRIPRKLNQEDCDELAAIIKEYLANQMEIEGEDFKVDTVDEQLIKNVALFAETQISPSCSFWGGIIAQEVIKLTGKYTPLRQWLHHDFFEALPEGNVTRKLTNDRYEDFNVIFGS